MSQPTHAKTRCRSVPTSTFCSQAGVGACLTQIFCPPHGCPRCKGGSLRCLPRHLRISRSGSHRLSPQNPGRTLYDFMSMNIAQALLSANTLCAKHQSKWVRAPVEFASFPLSPLSRRTTRMKRVTRDTSGLTYIRRIEKIKQAFPIGHDVSMKHFEK